jgi:hypothetical protein
LEIEKYPPFFQESDRQAIMAQKEQFLFVRAKVALLLASALLLSIPWKLIPSLTVPAEFIVAVLLVASIALTTAEQSRGFGALWINCRGIAEAIKAETWLFMMQAQPYLGQLGDRNAENLFMDRVATILRLRPTAASHVSVKMTDETQITEHMKQTRNQPLQKRISYYIQNRIGDQKKWYATKAVWNKKRETVWFAFGWLLELLAVVAAIAVVFLPDTIFDPVQTISAASAGVLFWLNARAYKEPAESYGAVATDLDIQRNYAVNVDTEEALSRLVSDTEETIAREQKVWLAKL